MTQGHQRRLASRATAGFTIIELMVVMLIMILVTGVVAVGVGQIRRTDLTTTAGQLDSTVRYLYQLSSINGVPYRLVIDMDEGKWFAEAMELDPSDCRSFAVKDVRRKESFADRWQQEKRKKRGHFGKGSKAARKGEEKKRCAEAERDASGECPKTGFEAVEDRVLSVHELPKGIQFTGVMTTHQQELQPEGKAYVYFFPDGRVEKAFIYLSTEHDTFTVETFSLLGKVKVHHEKLDMQKVLRPEKED